MDEKKIQKSMAPGGYCKKMEETEERPNVAMDLAGSTFFLKPCGIFTVLEAGRADNGNNVAVMIMGEGAGEAGIGYYLEGDAEMIRAFGTQMFALADELEKEPHVNPTGVKH